jgi:uncharacterized protein YciI
VDLEAFELVILRRPATRPDCDEQTAQRLQDEHQAYLTWLHEAGHTVASGPLGDQDDESLRGLVFYRTGSLDEARRLASADPAVRAGRLATEVMTWCCMPGTMKLPGRILHIPDE